LKNVEASKLIKEALDKRAEKTQVDAEWVLKRLSKESDADIAAMLRRCNNLSKPQVDNLEKPIKTYH